MILAINGFDIHTRTKVPLWVFWNLSPHSKEPVRGLNSAASKQQTNLLGNERSRPNCLDPSCYYGTKSMYGQTWTCAHAFRREATEIYHSQTDTPGTPLEKYNKNKNMSLITVEGSLRETFQILPLCPRNEGG